MPETKSNSKQNSSSTPVKKGKLSSKSAFSVKKNQKNDHLTTKAPSKKAPTHRINPVEQSEKKVPLWLVFIFLFSLVFFLFALYKAFIFKKGYNLPFGEEPLTGQTTVQQPDFLFQEDQQQESGDTHEEGGNIEEVHPDVALIQNFYTYLTNNKIDEMNNLVDRPLKTSSTWITHWNKKNINIFTKHLTDTVVLQDVFLLPGSVNEEKKTRKYSYTLKYTIQPNHPFEEEWEVTLLTRGDKPLISEIMCKTEGCSHSPFFWPQNYNLQ